MLAPIKKQPPDAVREVAAAGIIGFGENYLQEALEKIPKCGEELKWHFIGTIQSNKTRAIAAAFDWVQTVASLRIAERLSLQRAEGAPDLQVCIQVQLDSEGKHGGAPADEVPRLADQIDDLPRLRLRGLMGMPIPTSNLEEQRRPFRTLHGLMEYLRDQGHDIDTLSMGMSDDLEAAILEGTTMLRIGSGIFGPRKALPATAE
ncbi:MAG: YggS family pyridoxal phosphate-dependent enzyme [Pseudomonadota bacterium]|nr:YggS family pyridoxal phosphate-dependent enzyme [Pseudomonadota bacterium]